MTTSELHTKLEERSSTLSSDHVHESSQAFTGRSAIILSVPDVTFVVTSFDFPHLCSRQVPCIVRCADKKRNDLFDNNEYFGTSQRQILVPGVK